MIFLRSLLFNALFYVSLIAQMILWSPYYFLAPRRQAWIVPKFWARSSLWLMRLVVGARLEIAGLDNLPDGPCILAPKHQSFLDTFAFVPYIPDAVYIVKRELTWIPLFGWYLAKMNMIAIDRAAGASALRRMLAAVKGRARENRQLVIYPEGTRRPPGAQPAYKHGVAQIYSALGLPVVPIAHQAGLFWPRRRFLRFPGVIKARILPPIPPGLSRDAFMQRLTGAIETACDDILAETALMPDPPPMPATARARLAALGVEIARLRQ